MIADDIAGLFTSNPAGPAPDSSLRQGFLLTFNTSTGANTVQLGTTVLTNVPLLLTGSETGLSAGNNVILMQIGNTYCILGRIATPGGASFASASTSSVSLSNTAQNFAVGTSMATIVSITIPVPTWANTAVVQSNFAYNAKNNHGSDVDMGINIRSDGTSADAGAPSMTFYGHNASYNGCSMGHSIKHTVTPGGSMLIEGRADCTGGFAADAGNSAFLSTFATFTKS